MKPFVFLRNKKTPQISKDDALAIARQECVNRGWSWIDPVDIRSARGNWIIKTNLHAKGANVVIVINQTNGDVISTNFLSR